MVSSPDPSLTYTQPILFVFLATAAVGLWRLKECRRKWLAIAGVVGIFLATWPPIDWLLSRPLEARYPVRPFQPRSPIQAIVILGEQVLPPQFEAPFLLAGSNTYQRCEEAAWIFGRYGPAPLLVSGGGVVATTMRLLLRRDGIPDSLIWSEEQSLSTHENAVYSAKILREHKISRIVLVVDATSMPRAAACFRKLGFDVVPAPSNFRTPGPWRDEVLPSWQAIRHNEDTLHEVLGLLWYRMHGWI